MNHAIFSQAFTEDALVQAFRKVRANRGCAGSDGVSADAFQRELAGELARLEDELRSGAYRPRRLLRVRTKKKSGGERLLQIPCVRDRVVQTALLQTLTPHVDPMFHDNSFAYRPGRGVSDAIDRLRQWHCETCWIVDTDISAYFDSIDHARLRLDLTWWIRDPDVLALMQVWLKGFSRRGRGVAQGSPISPFFSNVFLHPVDCLLEAEGLRAVRYADDILILAQSNHEAERHSAFFERLLRQRGLRKNEQKSAILPPGDPFVYLGVRNGLAEGSAA